MQFQVNDSKNVTIQVGDRYFARNAIQTHFVQIGENYIDLVKRYVAPPLSGGGHPLHQRKDCRPVPEAGGV